MVWFRFLWRFLLLWFLLVATAVFAGSIGLGAIGSAELLIISVFAVVGAFAWTSYAHRLARRSC